MKNWMKYGSIGVCFWSLLLVLVGVSQLTFGAYYISKLPVFKIGSPVWIGFLNILFAAGLFSLHQKMLGLRDVFSWRRSDPLAELTKPKPLPDDPIHQKCGELVLTMRPTHLYWSLCHCAVIVLINIGNAIICEVGEWQHWISHVEREQLRTFLSVLALQAHRVTAAQMSLAIIIGLICTGLNIWLVYKQRQVSRPDDQIAQSIPARQAAYDPVSLNTSIGTNRSKKVSVSPVGYDNPNWVYGENHGSAGSTQGVLLHPEPEAIHRRPVSVSVISDGGTGGMRYATIRRAPSILTALPPDHHFTPQRIHLKSASFRFGSERDQLRQTKAALKVNRSKTMRETSFTTAPFSTGRPVRTFEPTHTFAQRFQSSLDGTSALSFVHDVSTAEEEEAEGRRRGPEEEEDERTGGISVASTALVASDSPSSMVESPAPPKMSSPLKMENGMQTTVEVDVLREEEKEAPVVQVPVVRKQQVRSSDRIILRVESFRTMNQPGGTVRITPRPQPGRNNQQVKRVSSSTQTELSVLKGVVRHGSSTAQQQQQQRIKRSIILQSTQYQSSKGSKTNKGSADPSSNSQTSGAGGGVAVPHLSPVESSSGYSSPRGTESKSPTPEPVECVAMQNGEQQQQMAVIPSTAANVTVIQIDPKPMPKKDLPRVTDVTYAIPRKRSERERTPTEDDQEAMLAHPDMGFQVSIQTKPVNRSVSFHHMSQAGRKAVYGNEWLNAGSLLGNHLPPLVTSIPRPALRYQQHRLTPSSSLRRQNSHVINQQLAPSGSSLSRSTSMYLAMSEIQRKLDLLQVLGARHHQHQPKTEAFDYREYTKYKEDDYHYSGSPSNSEGGSSRRSKNRMSSRQQQTVPPPPPPPPPPAMPPSPPPPPSSEQTDSLDSAKTLAYLSELEMLARHWRTQLLYKVELKTSSHRMGTVLENDSFQC